jgi:hypothetical protein
VDGISEPVVFHAKSIGYGSDHFSQQCLFLGSKNQNCTEKSGWKPDGEENGNMRRQQFPDGLTGRLKPVGRILRRGATRWIGDDNR